MSISSWVNKGQERIEEQSHNGSAPQWPPGSSIPTATLYVIFCLLLTVAAYLRPLPTFDRYMYAGAVASLQHLDAVRLQETARTAFERQPSPFSFKTVASEPYFMDVYTNPDHFAQQMPFYRVKMGYIVIGYGLWRAGMPILSGLRWLSAVSFLGLGLVLLLWTRNPILSAMLMLTPPVLDLGRMVTPDALSTFIVVLALFLWTTQKEMLATILLLAGLCIRFDNVVFLALLLLWMMWRRRIFYLYGVLCIAVAVGEAMLMNHLSGGYGWRVLMQHTFIRPEVDPAVHPIKISLQDYFHALLELRVIPYTHMTFFVLMGAVAWKQLRNSRVAQLLSIASVSILVRFFLFPNVDDRYFAWAYVLASVALIQTTSSFDRKDPAQEAHSRL